MKYSFVNLLTLLLLLNPCVACAAAEADPAAAKPSMLVVLAKTANEIVTPVLTAYGSIAPDPNQTQMIVMPHEALVKSVPVRPGQIVQTGESLITIETSAGAATQYTQAKNALDFAKKDLTRLQQLFKQQLATHSDLAAAEKTLADAKAVLEQQRKLGTGLAAETLTAPFEGVVVSVSAIPGSRVPQDTVVATIARRNALIVSLGVEPEDAPRIVKGAKVDFVSSLDPKIHFSSTVASVGGMIDPQSHLVDVTINVPVEQTPRLVLGMPLSAAIFLPGQQGITVPRSAILEDAQGAYVFVVDNDVAHKHPVAIMLETKDKVIIGGNLKAGVDVVVVGNAALDEGSNVREDSEGTQQK